MKNLAIYSLAVLLTLCAIFLLYVFRVAVILFLLSLFTASAVRPIISRLTKRGFSTLAAIALTYFIGIIVVGSWVYLVGQIAIPELQELLNQLANRYQALQQGWQDGTTLQQLLAGRLPPPQDLLDALVAEEGTLLAQALVTVLGSTASFLAALVIMLVLSVYWSLDRLRFEGLWLSLLPAAQRRRARKVWRTVEEGVGNYLRNQGLQAFLAVVLLAGGYFVMGINYPILLALLGAVAWLIPVVGFIFAALAALLVGMANSPIIGVLAAIYTVTMFVALQQLVERALLRYRRDFSYLLVVLLMIPLAETYGFFGLLAAPPLAVSIESLLTIVFDNRRGALAAEEPQARLVELHEELEVLRERALAAGDSVSPEIANLMSRLEKLMVRSRTLLQSDYPLEEV